MIYIIEIPITIDLPHELIDNRRIVDTATSLMLGTCGGIIHTVNLYVRQPDGKPPVYWIETRVLRNRLSSESYDFDLSAQYIGKFDAALFLYKNNIPQTDDLQKEFESRKI